MSRRPDAASAAAQDAENEAFVADFWDRLGAHEGSRAGFVLTHLRLTIRMVLAILRLPRVPAAPADNHDGRYLREVLSHRSPSGLLARRLGNAILDVPADPEEYSLGRARQTLRRKVRAAQRQGLTWREVPPEERPALLAAAIAQEPHHPDERYAQDRPELDDLPDFTVWVGVYDAAGAPLLLAVSPAEAGWGALRYFRTLGWSTEHSNARYLGTLALVHALGSRGVRQVLDPTPPGALSNGLRHFQRMVGFRYARVELRRIGYRR